VRVDERGVVSTRFGQAERGALCIFEFVYLARPDSRLRGTTVHEVRRELGGASRSRRPPRATS
jgi:amidophosphoribosyltransferase